MSFLQKFTETPSIDLLNVCKLSELKELCVHHEIPYDNAAIKSTLRQLVIDNLTEQGIMDQDDSDAPRHNTNSIELQKYQLELEYKERMERAQMAADREKHEKALEAAREKHEKALEAAREKHTKELQADREKHDKEMELKRFEIETQAQIKIKEIERNSRPMSSSSQFDISTQKGYVPPFNEYDVDLYFAQFEKVASQLEWPTDKWAIVLQTVLKGKAQTTYAALSVERSKDYDHVKKAILQAYQLVPEAYRQRFRDAKKASDQTYVEFVSDSEYMLDRWCMSSNVDKDYEKFRQLILLEQFQFSLPRDVAMYVDDRTPKDVRAAAMIADSYEVKQRVYHRNTAQQQYGYNTPSNFRDGNGNPFIESRYQDNPTCWYCKKIGHMRVACPLLNKDKQNQASNALICKQTLHEDKTDVNPEYPEEYQPFISHGKVSLKNNDSFVRDITILRDTGATQTLILSDVLPFNKCSSCNTDVLVTGIGTGYIQVPQHKLYLTSEFNEGYVVVGIREKLPVPGVTMLLGNDIAGSIVNPHPRVDCRTSEHTNGEDLIQDMNRVSPVLREVDNSINIEDIVDVSMGKTFICESNENADISGVSASADDAVRHLPESSELGMTASLGSMQTTYQQSKDDEIKSLVDDVYGDHSFVARYDVDEPGIPKPLNTPPSVSYRNETQTVKQTVTQRQNLLNRCGKLRKDVSEFVNVRCVFQVADKPKRKPPKLHYLVAAYGEPLSRVTVDCVASLRMSRKARVHVCCVLILLLMGAHLLLAVRDSTRNSYACSPVQIALGYSVRHPMSPMRSSETSLSSREECVPMLHYVSKLPRPQSTSTRCIAADKLAHTHVRMNARFDRYGFPTLPFTGQNVGFTRSQ